MDTDPESPDDGEQGNEDFPDMPSGNDATELPPEEPPLLPYRPLLERLDELAVDGRCDPGVSDDDDEPVGPDGGWANYQQWHGDGVGTDSDDSRDEPDLKDSNDPPDTTAGNREWGESKRLDEVHIGLGGKVMEGGARLCAFNTKAKRSPYFPYENLSVLLFYQLVHKYQVSEVMLTGLLAILRTRHNGKGFDVDDIRHITAKHFYGRRRAHHPLLDVVETFVPSSKDNGTSVPVL
ncbi:unnamed protein product [Ectocarpus sp. CCAP 1310/34]|nr:unnamed protein product [Ectocarpus sp. CCAP 1310/34]